MSSTLTFPATTSTDDAMQCIDISITNDDVFGGDEVFIVTLTTTNTQVTLGDTYTIVIITDDEGQYNHNFSVCTCESGPIA